MGSQTFKSLTDLFKVSKTSYRLLLNLGTMDPPMELENPPFYAIRL